MIENNIPIIGKYLIPNPTLKFCNNTLKNVINKYLKFFFDAYKTIKITATKLITEKK